MTSLQIVDGIECYEINGGKNVGGNIYAPLTQFPNTMSISGKGTFIAGFQTKPLWQPLFLFLCYIGILLNLKI